MGDSELLTQTSECMSGGTGVENGGDGGGDSGGWRTAAHNEMGALRNWKSLSKEG